MCVPNPRECPLVSRCARWEALPLFLAALHDGAFAAHRLSSRLKPAGPRSFLTAQCMRSADERFPLPATDIRNTSHPKRFLPQQVVNHRYEPTSTNRGRYQQSSLSLPLFPPGPPRENGKAMD